MLHWNSIHYQLEFSYGFEISFWSYPRDTTESQYQNFPDINKAAYGFDLGMDYGKGKLRFYAEPQAEWKMVGLSLGPVVEKRKDENISYGVQSSLWSLVFPFVDLRYRHINRDDCLAPGLYARWPIAVSGRE